jgi:hypothetical protein
LEPPVRRRSRARACSHQAGIPNSRRCTRHNCHATRPRPMTSKSTPSTIRTTQPIAWAPQGRIQTAPRRRMLPPCPRFPWMSFGKGRSKMPRTLPHRPSAASPSGQSGGPPYAHCRAPPPGAVETACQSQIRLYRAPASRCSTSARPPPALRDRPPPRSSSRSARSARHPPPRSRPGRSLRRRCPALLRVARPPPGP